MSVATSNVRKNGISIISYFISSYSGSVKEISRENRSLINISYLGRIGHIGGSFLMTDKINCE